MVKGKRGSEKYYIIMSIILGIIVLGLSLYFIFNEYFTKNDLDWETCRQSIILRANLPEEQLRILGTNPFQFKNDFPLKCKTKKIEIDKKDLGKNLEGAKKIIGDAMVECWALFDNGDSSAFPSPKFIGGGSTCVPCARIHLTEEAKEDLNNKISIREALDSKMGGREYSYWAYLNNSGKKFPALNFGSGQLFNLEEKSFEVRETNIFEDTKFIINPVNKLNGVKTNIKKAGEVDLPQFYYYDKGDLLIFYGTVLISGSSEFGNYIPYLFYFQEDQNPEPFSQFENSIVGGVWGVGGTGFCEVMEGIPA